MGHKLVAHKLIAIKQQVSPRDIRAYDSIIDMWIKMERLETKEQKQKAMQVIVDDVVNREVK